MIWKKDLISDRFFILVEINPLYHLLETCRAPLVGQIDSAYMFSVSVCLAMAIVGWSLTLLVYRGLSHKSELLGITMSASIELKKVCVEFPVFNAGNVSLKNTLIEAVLEPQAEKTVDQGNRRGVDGHRFKNQTR